MLVQPQTLRVHEESTVFQISLRLLLSSWKLQNKVALTLLLSHDAFQFVLKVYSTHDFIVLFNLLYLFVKFDNAAVPLNFCILHCQFARLDDNIFSSCTFIGSLV